MKKINKLGRCLKKTNSQYSQYIPEKYPDNLLLQILNCAFDGHFTIPGGHTGEDLRMAVKSDVTYAGRSRYNANMANVVLRLGYSYYT